MCLLRFCNSWKDRTWQNIVWMKLVPKRGPNESKFLPVSQFLWPVPTYPSQTIHFVHSSNTNSFRCSEIQTQSLPKKNFLHKNWNQQKSSVSLVILQGSHNKAHCLSFSTCSSLSFEEVHHQLRWRPSAIHRKNRHASTHLIPFRETPIPVVSSSYFYW